MELAPTAMFATRQSAFTSAFTPARRVPRIDAVPRHSGRRAAIALMNVLLPRA